MNFMQKRIIMNLPNFTEREISKAISSYTYTYGAYMMILDELIAEVKLVRSS